MPTPSWDLAIIVFFIIGIVFGYILQKEKIVATLLSVYVSLVVTQALSGFTQEFFKGDKTVFGQVWIRSDASPFTIRLIIFMAVIMLLSAKSGVSVGKSKGLISPLEVIVYSILTTGLIISSIFYFMPPESREAFAASSKMASLLVNNYLWWVILPVLILIVSSFFKKSSSSSSSSD